MAGGTDGICVRSGKSLFNNQAVGWLSGRAGEQFERAHTHSRLSINSANSLSFY